MGSSQDGAALLAAIRARRSIRKWQDRPIPREHLERILEAAVSAPSADNLQPWRFVVFQRERKQELAALLHRFVGSMQPGANPVLWVHRFGMRRAAGMVARAAAVVTAWATFSPDDAAVRLVARGDLAPLFTWTMVVESVAAAVENQLLAAHALGLGAVWLGYPNLATSEVERWLGVEGQLMATVALGYPAEQPAPRRRKPLQSVVRWEG